jgi:hypothetical protein
MRTNLGIAHFHYIFKENKMSLKKISYNGLTFVALSQDKSAARKLRRKTGEFELFRGIKLHVDGNGEMSILVGHPAQGNPHYMTAFPYVEKIPVTARTIELLLPEGFEDYRRIWPELTDLQMLLVWIQTSDQYLGNYLPKVLADPESFYTIGELRTTYKQYLHQFVRSAVEGFVPDLNPNRSAPLSFKLQLLRNMADRAEKRVINIHLVHGWTDGHLGCAYYLTVAGESVVKTAEIRFEPDFTDWQISCPGQELVKTIVASKGYVFDEDVTITIVDTGN